jgi:hypothetical protein
MQMGEIMDEVVDYVHVELKSQLVEYNGHLGDYINLTISNTVNNTIREEIEDMSKWLAAEIANLVHDIRHKWMPAMAPEAITATDDTDVFQLFFQPPSIPIQQPILQPTNLPHTNLYLLQQLNQQCNQTH